MLENDVDERKPDLSDLFEIYGAVDQELKSRPHTDTDEVPSVALLLPEYRGSDPYWYEQYVGTPLVESLDLPSSRVRNVLGALADTEPRSRNRARRLFAASVAAHTFPDLTDEELAAAALGRRQLEEGGEGAERAAKLAAALRRDPETDTPAGRDALWELQVAATPNPELIGPRPCSGGLSWVELNGDRDPVPTIKTEYETPIAFDDARRFCDEPKTWTCFPCWCHMDYLETRNGVRLYQEIVSFHCHDDTYPKFTVKLNFATEFDKGPPRVVTTEYWLADKSEPRVLVNQGYLEVREVTGRAEPTVNITTTKSLKFAGNLGGAGLALVACRLGYLDMLEDLIVCASRKPGEKGYPDVPFRGRRPDGKSPAGRYGSGSDYGWVIKTMVDEVGAAVEDCVDEWAKAAQSCTENLESGYKANDLAQDMADGWIRALRQGARLTDIAVRAVQTAPKTSEQPAPPAPPAPTPTQEEQ